MIACLDTDVLIDCWRGLPAARQWMVSSVDQILVVPGIVAMEMVSGCRDNREVRDVERFIADFPVEWPGADEIANAYALLVRLRLSNGLGIPDCIIASMALARGACLYTFNVRHFGAVSGLSVASPYDRTLA
ncbi:MAG: PIN domain-containing protein [Armatimonadetes bacterium]|nr:PIN domain-containing protein [Armatimonadota bacterium]